MIEVSETERQEVVSRCVEFLGKVWREVKDDQIECERITSGMANKTFHVWIKDLKGLENNNEIENSDVIVRIYNSGVFAKENKIKFNGESAEVIIHQRLFELGLASKLLGVFNGGRIEEYIPSRPVTVDELKSIELSKEVIRKVAKFHTLSMPISKKPNLLEKVAQMVKDTAITSNYLEKYPNEIEECEFIMKFPFEEEVAWMQQILPKVGYKVVFSHNDLNPNNILLKENENRIEEKLLLVDYEMCTYFYRAYDLAYFLSMKRARIQMHANEITFSFDDEDNDFATDELLLEYLKEYKQLNESDFDPEYDNLQRFRMEVEFFNLVQDLLNTGMAKVMIIETTISFSVTLCAKMVSEYEQKKRSLINKYGDPIHWKY